MLAELLRERPLFEALLLLLEGEDTTRSMSCAPPWVLIGSTGIMPKFC